MMLDVPQHSQSKYDFACGPMAIRMVADYYYKKEKKEMTATEWLSVLSITMENDIWRKKGTKKEDVIVALERLKFSIKKIKGSDYNRKLASIRKAIDKKHPVIIYCVIKPKERHRHFAVVVGIDHDHDSIYVRDPYPRKGNSGKPRRIAFDVFGAVSPEVGGLVWGRVKWGIEVIK